MEKSSEPQRTDDQETLERPVSHGESLARKLDLARFLLAVDEQTAGEPLSSVAPVRDYGVVHTPWNSWPIG